MELKRKYRHHRGTLPDSLATTIEIEPTVDALAAILGVDAERITVSPYGYDDRCGWDTHLVTIDGNAVGMTDGPLFDSEKGDAKLGRFWVPAECEDWPDILDDATNLQPTEKEKGPAE